MQLQVANEAQTLLRQELQMQGCGDLDTYRYYTARDADSYTARATLAVGSCIKHLVTRRTPQLTHTFSHLLKQLAASVS